jgi:hypothetical protein
MFHQPLARLPTLRCSVVHSGGGEISGSYAYAAPQVISPVKRVELVQDRQLDDSLQFRAILRRARQYA